MVVLGALVSFGVLVLALQQGCAAPLDEAVLQALSGLAVPWLTTLMLAITWLGSWQAIVVVLAVFAWRERHRWRTSVRRVLIAAAGGGGLSLALKWGIRRPRPDLSRALLEVTGFAFPSGHALLSLVCYGSLVAVLASRARSRREAVFIYLAGGALILAIGFTRLYLGVHHLTDVLAGYAAGIAWLGCVGLWLGRGVDGRSQRPTL
mgnify:CR=1 FL=1